MNIDQLLARSSEFTEHLFDLAGKFGPRRDDGRSRTAAAAGELSLEHGQALRILVAHAAGSSACALFRVQYEALLRAGWVLYAASEAEVGRASSELSAEASRAAQNLPGAKTMLEDLERALRVDPGLVGLVQPLQEIRAQSWAAMNSFVHAGLHPLSRSAQGFPMDLADNVVRQSNAMMHMAVRLLYRLSQRAQVNPLQVERSYAGFEDCLPMAAAK